MIEELKKQECWNEFKEWMVNKGFTNGDGVFMRFIYGVETYVRVSTYELHALAIEYLDSKGMYFTWLPMMWSKDRLCWSYRIYYKPCIYTDSIKTYTSRTLATEAGIIKAFTIRSEQIKTEVKG